MGSMVSRLWSLAPAMAVYGVGVVVRGMEVIGKFLLYVLAAHRFGVFEAGLFFLCLTWMGLASTIARMGLERALTRHLAAAAAVKDFSSVRSDLLKGMLLTTCGGVVAALLTYAFAEPVSIHLFGEPALVAPMQTAALAIVPWTLSVVIGGILAGFQQGVLAQLIQNSLWPALTVLGLVAHAANTIEDLLVFLAAAMLAAAALGVVPILRFLARHPASTTDTTTSPALPEGVYAMPALWRTALPLSVVEIVQVSLSSLPMLALGMFTDASTVGAFSVAHRISMMMWVVILAIGTISAPRFAASHRRGDMAELRRVNANTRLCITLLGVPMIAVMMLFPSHLLSILGNGFEIAATALVIMAAGQLVNCLLPCQDILLAMTGYGVQLRTLNLLQFFTCIVLGAILLPAFGLVGCAIVTAICIAQGAIGATAIVWRVMPEALRPPRAA
ncbi:O-antigen/teichoic acid export membrane protein [Pseudochelatococcus lubricantis]|uniref:O-antigen/teichoic acid export membrane protein n=1 Tax=Pseudochelatococcus lubricantis TaxID=1538102 RepID=A0ABX0V7B2_9HYPH|nr:oligosaccharide flippase family protein [Pseudochelatococcus lubricantis]NIJ59001.1 O-antigen/teichoic acid export membrane protein [Pseudochelatococcus lubricantis]